MLVNEHVCCDIIEVLDSRSSVKCVHFVLSVVGKFFRQYRFLLCVKYLSCKLVINSFSYVLSGVTKNSIYPVLHIRMFVNYMAMVIFKK